MLQSKPEFVPTIPPAVNPDLLAFSPQENCTYAPSFDDTFYRLQLENLSPITLLPEKLTPKKLIRRAMAYTAIFGTLAYGADVSKNIAAEQEAVPSIEVIVESKDPNSTHAIIVENGFNTTDADLPASKLGPGLQQITDGEVWSVQSNNAISNTDALYDKVLDLVERRGIQSVSIATYSMGDMRGIETIEKVATESSIPVKSIIVMSGPSGYDGLREYQQKEMSWAQVANAFPGAAYSSFFRYLAETYFYRDIFTRPEDNFVDYITKNGKRLANVIDGINVRFDQGDYTSNAFLLRQISAIDSTDLEGLLKSIGEASDTTQRPLVVYVGSTAYDNMIDDDYSADKFEEFAGLAGLDFMKAEVEGVRHSEYYQPEAVKSYDALFAEISPEAKEIIQQNTLDYHQRVYEAFLTDAYNGDSSDDE